MASAGISFDSFRVVELRVTEGAVTMSEENTLIQKFVSKKKPRLKKPDWLRIRLGDPANQNAVLELVEGLNLHTVQIYSNVGPIEQRPSCSAATPALVIAVFVQSIRVSQWILIRWSLQMLRRRYSI